PPHAPPTPLLPAGAGVSRTGHPGEALGTLHTEAGFVVAGTDTDVGKTVLSAMGLNAIRRLGPAGYWKPVQTGDDDDTQTVRRLAEAPGCEFAEPLRHYPLPASPHEAAAAAGTAVPVEELTPALREILERDRSRRWIVELAGGVLVPYRSDRTQLEWLREFRFPLLLAVRSGLGTLNHTLLTVAACERAGLPIAALFLIGDPHPSNRRTLIEMTRVPHVFEVPRFEPLDSAAVEEWVSGSASHAGKTLDAVLEEALVRRGAGDPTAEALR
ncbi:MAG: dethiobiotin synthase, partial [Planctomycetota bacterium]